MIHKLIKNFDWLTLLLYTFIICYYVLNVDIIEKREHLMWMCIYYLYTTHHKWSCIKYIYIYIYLNWILDTKVYILCVQNVHHGIWKYNFPLINTGPLSPSDTSMGGLGWVTKEIIRSIRKIIEWVFLSNKTMPTICKWVSQLLN